MNTGYAQQWDVQVNIAPRLTMLRKSIVMLKTSTPVLRSSIGRPNRDLYNAKTMLTRMVMLNMNTTVLDMQG